MGSLWSPEFELEYFSGLEDGELLSRHKAHADIFGLYAAVGKHAVKEPLHVLEVGCGGIGGMLSVFAGGEHRYAIDPLADEYDRLTPDAKTKSNFTWVKAFAHLLPFNTGTADILFCIETLDHCDNLEQFAQAQQELVRVLNKGGLLFFMLPARDDRPEGHDGHPSNPPGTEILRSFESLGLTALKSNHEKEGTWLLLKR